jgi:hypothetical protein
MYASDVAGGMAEAEVPLTKTACVTLGGRKRQEQYYGQ